MTPEELYGIPAANVSSPAATSTPPSTPTTGGAQTYIPPTDVYGQPIQHQGINWEQIKEDMPALAGAAVTAPPFAAAGAETGTAILPGPGTVIGGALGAVIGAGIGGAGGKGYQLAYKEATGSLDAPETSYDAAVQIAKAGGEQAAWELVGQGVGRGAAKAFWYVRPKAVEGIEKLNVALEKMGGKFSAAQRSDSWVLHQLDSLTRGSMSGSGVMKAHDILNEQAIKNLEAFTTQNIAKQVTENLSPKELGTLFMNTVNGGKDGFKTAVGNMYEGFDSLVPPKTILQPQTVMNQSGVDAAGKPIMQPTQQMVSTVIQPVDMTSVKNSLKPLEEQLRAINYTGESSESINLLNSLKGVDDRLSFSNAQALRSNLLDAQRRLQGDVGKTKILGKINDVVDDITKAMDTASANEGPDVLKKYLAIKDYSRKGYEAFNDKFVNKLLEAGKDNPADIGKTLFSIGNEQEIQNAKRAIRYSSQFTKDPAMTYDQVWPKMQAGYLEDVLYRNSSFKGVNLPATATQENIRQLTIPQGKALLDEFTDPAKKRTLASVFTKEQRDSIFQLAQVAERVQRKPQGGLSMVAAIGQGGVIVQTLSGAVNVGKAAITFIPTYAIARIATDPRGAKILATALETPIKNPRAVTAINQLVMEAHKANQSENQ